MFDSLFRGRGGLLALLVAASLARPSGVDAQSPTPKPALAGLDLHAPRPPGGRPAPGAVSLGRTLFFDRTLSRDSTLACSSCHQPEHAFTDGRPVGVGVDGRQGTRNVPTLINRAWGESFFWDGRVETLEETVLRPITAPLEMDLSVEAAVDRIRAESSYRTRFRRVFGEDVGRAEVARALAAYVRSIRAGDSPFDRAMDGDPGALTDEERLGQELFQGRARCARCHFGPLLSDESFHNTGVGWGDGEAADSGRALVTGRPEDVAAFKTPSLREVSRTAPYMHDGSLATLEEVVEFYDEGGRPNPHLDGLIRPLGLDDGEKDALVAFLRALTGRVVEARTKSR